jgi:hypothetical protein
VVTVHDGASLFHVYQTFGGQPPTLLQFNLDLLEENCFLNLLDRPPGPNPNRSFHEFRFTHNADDSNSNLNTMGKIMAFENKSVFYLCREFISSKWMYFILWRPRSKSSLCTLVFMLMRPDTRLVHPAVLLEQKKNTLMPSAILPTHPNYTLHWRSRFGQISPSLTIPYPHPPSTAQALSELERHSHGQEFNPHDSKYFSYHGHPQQSSPLPGSHLSGSTSNPGYSVPYFDPNNIFPYQWVNNADNSQFSGQQDSQQD